MRVSILTSVHPPLDTRVYFKQARSLARAGHEVALVARDGGEPEGVRYMRLRVPDSRLARLGADLRVFVAAIRLRGDVHHVHDPELLPIGVLVKWLVGGKLVYDIHENVREQIRNKYWIPAVLRGVVARAHDFVEWLCLRAVDHIILAEDSYRANYPGLNVSVVRNYPILRTVESNLPGRRSYSGRPVLGYCGGVTEIRGALQMVEVLAHLLTRCPEAELRIVGPLVPESLEDRIRARATELGISDRVRLLGRLPLDAALREMAACDVGLVLLHPEPNYVDSLPTKMFEYMSLRLPVVASHFPRWRAIVETAGCGLAVDPFDVETIAAKIAELNADPERMAQLGECGRSAVLEQYSWAAEERTLLAVYDSLDGKRRSPREAPDVVVRRVRGVESSAVHTNAPAPIGAGSNTDTR